MKKKKPKILFWQEKLMAPESATKRKNIGKVKKVFVTNFTFKKFFSLFTILLLGWT